jgi:3-ketosteroid 9alpha-monooxygenase subunit B
MVTILAGAVKMRANQVLSEEDIRSGLALGCQSVPVTDIIEIEIL